MKAELLDLSPVQYHADALAETPTLSPSQAFTLISQSAAHLWLEHPRLGNQPRPIGSEKQKNMELGSLLHKLILGAGKEYQVIVGFDDYKTALARQMRDDIRAGGYVPILESDFDECARTAEAIKEQLTVRGIDLSGRSEMMMAFTETTDEGEPVLCRMMPDHFIYDTAEIYELKAIYCAHPQRCEIQIDAMGYDIQMAAYMTGIAELYPELAGRLEYFWIFFEAGPPYSITVMQPDGALRELGEHRWRKAVNYWHQCLSTNTWPQYSEGVITASARVWRLKEELGGEFYGE